MDELLLLSGTTPEEVAARQEPAVAQLSVLKVLHQTGSILDNAQSYPKLSTVAKETVSATLATIFV
jgi:hypothetical protein